MNESDFRKFVANRCTHTDILFVLLGVFSEAGELAAELQKPDYKGTDVNWAAFDLELSDLVHYVTMLAIFRNLTLDELRQINYDKLIKRDKEKK